MKCPNCGLFNPESAQRCDCGYDFDKGTMEKPYYIEKPREDSKASKILVAVYIILQFSFWTIFIGMVLIMVFNTPPLPVFFSIVTYYGFCCFLYVQLRKRKNWARITLIIITFPFGPFYFTSQELKLYCLQQEGLEKKR
jgi:hypothetical protein